MGEARWGGRVYYPCANKLAPGLPADPGPFTASFAVATVAQTLLASQRCEFCRGFARSMIAPHAIKRELKFLVCWCLAMLPQVKRSAAPLFTRLDSDMTDLMMVAVPFRAAWARIRAAGDHHLGHHRPRSLPRTSDL